MRYENLAHTDLRVSRLCQGTAFRNLPRANSARALEVLHYAIERGINFFDTAIAYGWGGAEEVLGKAIAGRRDKVVLCTKVPASRKDGTRTRYTANYVRQQLEASLQRLGTDCVDLYLLHHYDADAPPAEINASMQTLVSEGKTRYWGLSNHTAAQVRPLLDLDAPIACLEEYYNIAGMHLDDEGRPRTQIFDEQLQPLLQRSGIGCLAFSPMDTGHLAATAPPNTPLDHLLQCIDLVGAQLQAARAAVCIAWVNHQPGISSVLCGAENDEQIDANIQGIELDLPADLLDQLNSARRTFLAAHRKDIP